MAIVNISQHASLRPTLGNEGKWFLQGNKDFYCPIGRNDL